MKKKIRKIVVNGIEYFWKVEQIIFCKRHLTVWKNKNNKLVDRMEVNDEINIVTPSYVKEIIEKKLKEDYYEND